MALGTYPSPVQCAGCVWTYRVHRGLFANAWRRWIRLRQHPGNVLHGSRHVVPPDPYSIQALVSIISEVDQSVKWEPGHCIYVNAKDGYLLGGRDDNHTDSSGITIREALADMPGPQASQTTVREPLTICASLPRRSSAAHRPNLLGRGLTIEVASTAHGSEPMGRGIPRAVALH